MPIRDELRELWKYRELLLMLVQRDLRVRYKNSILGFGWSLVNPLAQVATIALALKFFLPAPVPPSYHLYLFCATLPWVFFSSAVMDSGLSLLTYQELIRRVYFPRALIPLAAVSANLIHFVLATGVFLVYATLNSLFWGVVNHHLEWPIALTAPVALIPMAGLALLMSGMAMILSVWTVYFDDIRYLADSGLRILYWLVPIIYFPDDILHSTRLASPATRELVYTLYMLNPLASFMSAFRKLLLVPTIGMQTEQPYPSMTSQEWLFLGLALLTSVVVAVGGYQYFSSRQWRLAERP